MQNYYYPLCTKDFTFENIFASESVSPAVFYKQRGFGIDYFYVLPRVNNENFIALFNAPPQFDSPGATGFILEISPEGLNLDELIFISEGIVGYPKTIFLNKKNFRIHFFSEKDRKIAILQSETSLPTKTVYKYLDNYGIIDRQHCKSFDFDVSNVHIGIPDLKGLLLLDRRYNCFKGMIYGIAAGWMGAKSPEEIQLKRLFQEVTNSFAELKNRIDEQKNITKSYSTHKNAIPLSNYLSKVTKAISAAEALFYTLFPDQEISDKSIAEFLIGEFKGRLKTYEEVRQYLDYIIINDQIFETNNFAKLKSYVIKQAKISSMSSNFEILHNQVVNYINGSKFTTPSKGNLESNNDSFKDALRGLDKFVSSFYLNRVKDRKISFKGIGFDFDENNVAIEPGFLALEKSLIKDVEIINNAILTHSKVGKGAAPKETILAIIEEVGKSFSRSGKPTLLYQYINNEIEYYSIEKASSVVMKNFVAFVFNPDSLEKLENYLNSKNVNETWMAYSFWCSYNGFANISKNFTNAIMNPANKELQDYIDEYLQPYTAIALNHLPLPSSELPIKSISLPDYTSYSEKIKTGDRIITYFEQFIKDKYKISFDEFNGMLKIRDIEEFCQFLKTKLKLSKKESIKLYNGLSDYFNSSSLF
jgi:hypothetical protein